jgi:hypothetical protein
MTNDANKVAIAARRSELVSTLTTLVSALSVTT